MKKRSITFSRILVVALLAAVLGPLQGQAQLSAGTLSPSNWQVPSGQSYTITITSVTAGSGCTGTGTYSWVMGTSTANAVPIPGTGNTPSLTYTGTWSSTMEIWRVYTCSTGGSVFTSAPVAIVAQPAFTPGTVSPASQTIITGASAATLTATVSTGSAFGPTYTYQWQSSPDGVTWTNAGSSSTTDPTFSPGAITATTFYRQAVTAGPLTEWTNVATVTVGSPPPLSPGAVSPATSSTLLGTNGTTLSVTGVTGGTPPYTYQWESSPDNATWQAIAGATSSTYTPVNVTAKTYYMAYVTGGATLPSVSGVVILQGQLSTVPAADNQTGSPNSNMNWVISISFDASGNTLSQSKGFYDNAGRQVQSQQKVFYRASASSVLTHVLASETVRDAENRDVLTTLPAPIDYADFNYIPGFVQAADGSNYTYKNFDRFNPSGTETDLTNTPQGVGGQATKGTLGWYYGSGNTWEPYLPTSNYPYSRKSIYRDGTNNVKKQAASGEAFVMGSNHEIASAITPVSGELTNYLQVRNRFFSASQIGNLPSSLLNNAIQTVQKDANGNETVSIADVGGKSLLTARPGTDMPFSNSFSIVSDGSGTQPMVGYFKILADNTAVSITGSYTLYDMNTETVTSLNAGVLNRGYYKVVSGGGTVTVSYSGGFTDVSYNFYNQLGQLVASVPPNGVKLLEGSGYLSYPTLASIPFVSTYTYDAQGRQVAAITPDGGARQFIYRMDGQIRFSQNARQAVTGSYSYTNYDALGRPFESGQYQPDASGVVFNSAGMTGILENTSTTGGLTTGTRTDVLLSVFDVADNTHGQTGYVQDPAYIGGAVSTTKRYSSIVNNTINSANLVSQTWYNYDESGQIVWMIKYIAALGPTVGYKTSDYTYDAMNRLVKKIFQKNASSETFVHYYQYDVANGDLLSISTNTVDNPATAMLQASYKYFLHGGIKRVELATNLQGIDYTYTLQGSLKAINNSNSAADPGKDAPGNNGFNADAFGESLDYYTNDYVNSRASGIQPIQAVSTGGITTDSYSGNVKAMTWYSLKPAGTGGSNSPTTYLFNYDPKYQLMGSTWGTGLNFAVNPATFTTTGVNKETVAIPGTGAPAYDANGNILNLQRTGATGTVTDQLAYTYTPNTNRLASIANTGSPAGTYTYSYDPTGREVSENTGGVAKYLQYDATGKVTLVARDAAFTQPVAAFVYDETGQKIEKLSYNASFQLVQVTYYYGDVIYTQTVTGTTYGPLTAQEYNIPGANGRLGVYYKQSNVYVYQLTDHLGNIRALIAQSGAIQTAEDYYPFGMAIATLGSAYRYGYQGQNSEIDPETGWNNFMLRMYNPRIARWLITDPYGQFDSPYEGMGNDPITGTDPDGGFDWFGHQNADGSVSTIDLAGVHDDMLSIVGEKWVNLGEDNIGGDQALANGNAYFSSFQGYFGNFHSQPFDIVSSWQESSVYSNRSQFSSVVAGTSSTTWSPQNDRKISQLDPRMQQPVANFINRSQQELGVRIYINESYRSIETQARYYAQGRTAPGPIITHAKPGWSFHQFRLAIDVYPTRANGQPNFNAIVSPEVVNIAEQEGLQWGGNFPPGKTDNPHFQMRFGMTITQVRALHGL